MVQYLILSGTLAPQGGDNLGLEIKARKLGLKGRELFGRPLMRRQTFPHRADSEIMLADTDELRDQERFGPEILSELKAGEGIHKCTGCISFLQTGSGAQREQRCEL